MSGPHRRAFLEPRRSQGLDSRAFNLVLVVSHALVQRNLICQMRPWREVLLWRIVGENSATTYDLPADLAGGFGQSELCATLLRLIMPGNKTKPTHASVDAYIESLPEARRADVKALVKLMQAVSRQKPKMWGPSIIGFGSYHYRYESGREGDMPLVCFSPRKSANVIYVCLSDKSLLKQLGKHKLSGGCLHISKLSDVDTVVLRQVVADSYANMREKHPK